MNVNRDRDPFVALNRILDAPHTATGSIRKAAQAVEDCIANNRDNLRGFFDKCFPTLLKRVFGYDDFEAAWLNIVTKPGKEEDARALVALLHPRGRLLAAMFSADADGLIKFTFPLERLPAHTQELLKTPSGRQELLHWPQFAGNLGVDAAGRPQVFLNVFEYYMFWSAFFVLRGASSGAGSRQAQAAVGRTGSSEWGLGGALGVGQWGRTAITDIRRMGTTLMSGLHWHHGAGLHVHPYFQLLRLYFESFLPRTGTVSGTAGSSTGGTGYSSTGGTGGIPRTLSSGGFGYAGASVGAAGGAVGMGGYGGAGSTVGGYGGTGVTPGVSSTSPVMYGGLDTTGQRMARQAAARPGDTSLGERVLSILIEFWLTDVAEPVPADLPSPAAGTTPLPGTAGGAGAVKTAGGADGGAGTPGGSGLVSSPLHTPAGMVSGGAGMGAGGVPGSAAAAVAGSSSTALRVLSFQPPGEEHVEALSQLMQYIHVAVEDGGTAAVAAGQKPPRKLKPAQGREPWLVDSPVRTVTALGVGGRGPGYGQAAPPLMLGASGSPPVQAISRKLYRFLRRTFAQWPLQTSTSLMPVINLWLSILTPWNPPPSTSAPAPTPSTATGPYGADAQGAGGHGGVSGSAAGGPESRFAHLGAELSSRLSNRRDGSAGGAGPGGAGSTGGSTGGGTSRAGSTAGAQYTPEWRRHVLAHLPFYCVLVPKFLELMYARLAFRGDAAASEALTVLRALADAGPGLASELKSAEAAYNRYLSSHMRRGSEAGPLAELVPWLAEQVADWEAAAAAGAPTNPPMQVDTTFRLYTLDATSGAAAAAAGLLRGAQAQVRGELRDALTDAALAALPHCADLRGGGSGGEQQGGGDVGGWAQGASKAYPRAGTWAALSYKGDWLHRPIASNEIGPLVRVFVWLSVRINAALGLDQPWRGPGQEDPPEHVLAEALTWARKRGYRVSLRPLAEVQTIGWLVVLYFVMRFIAAFLTR